MHNKKRLLILIENAILSILPIPLKFTAQILSAPLFANSQFSQIWIGKK